MLGCVRRTNTLVRASHNGRTGPQVERGLNNPTAEDGGLNYPTAEDGGLYDSSVDEWGLNDPSGGAWGLNDPRVNDWGHSGGAWGPRDLSSAEWGHKNPSGGTWGLNDPSVVARVLNGDIRNDPSANKNVRKDTIADKSGHCDPIADKSGLKYPSVDKYIRNKVSAVEFNPKGDQNADIDGQNSPSAVKCRNNACGHKGGRKFRVDLFCGANSRLHSVLILLFVIFTRISAAHSVSLGAHLVCSRMPGLTEKQRSMCRASPASIAAVGDGLKMAYNECRVQLAGSRWNCSGVGEGNIFGHVMPLATKEAAFTYAITSAGVAHALSAACARGDLPGCGCRHSHRRRHTPEQYHWGGCGELMYGIRFSRRFLDTREVEADARSEMNLHNNQVGRKMVKDLVRKDCKCHGVSGSCAVKTCWRALPTFRAVASALKEKYLKAKMVAPHHNSAHFVIRRSKPHLGEGREPRKNELVYLQLSPSYCEPDAASGILGTHGRRCKKNSRGEDSCEFLCCGRGYNTLRRNVTTQCHCQFHWCCRVTCDTCWNVTDTHLCK